MISLQPGKKIYFLNLHNYYYYRFINEINKCNKFKIKKNKLTN